jgi:hypothetical protein
MRKSLPLLVLFLLATIFSAPLVMRPRAWKGGPYKTSNSVENRIAGAFALANRLDMRDFGAVGDCLADDTAAWQNAIS